MMHMLRFRLGLLGRFLRKALHPSCTLQDNRAFAPIVLGAGLVVISGLTAATFEMFATSPQQAHLDEAQFYQRAFWALGVALMLTGLSRPARPALWPSVVHMTPTRLDGYADAIITALHQQMIALRDTIASQPNAPRDAWVLALGLPSTPPKRDDAPFPSLHLHNTTQAVIDTYQAKLAVYPWRTALEQVLGKKATHLGLLALHLRGDTALSIHVPAISAHDTLRLAAQHRAAPQPLHQPVTFAQVPLLVAA